MDVNAISVLFTTHEIYVKIESLYDDSGIKIRFGQPVNKNFMIIEGWLLIVWKTGAEKY